MIITINLPDVDVDIIRFECKSGCRRDDERNAVMMLIRRRFGEKAVLDHRDDGSPFVVGKSIGISVSHCPGIAALAVSPTVPRPGIDIERQRDTLRRVRHKFLSVDEIERCTTPDSLLDAWTVKEALYKAAGIPGIPLAAGLRLPDENGISMIAVGETVMEMRLYRFKMCGYRLSVALPVIP